MKAIPCHMPIFEEIPAVVMMSCQSTLICPKLVVFWCPLFGVIIVSKGVCLYLFIKDWDVRIVSIGFGVFPSKRIWFL